MTDEPQLPQLMIYQGQPWSKETATAKLAALDANKDFVAALLKNDVAKVQERTAFKQMSRGYSPGPAVAPNDVVAVAKEMESRDAERAAQVVPAFEKVVPMTAERRFQYQRNLAIEHQRDDAVMRREEMKHDPDFRARIFPAVGRPDPAAVALWVDTCRIANAPVAPADYDWGADKLP